MRKVIVFILPVLYFVNIVYVFALNGVASAAEGPVDSATAISACEERGGVWSTIDHVCIEEEEIAGLGSCDNGKTILGIPTWYKYLPGEEISGKCRPVVEDLNASLPIGLALIEASLTLAGIVAVIMVFMGGFKYVLAQGEADKAASGRKTVLNAMIGLVITILATRVISFIGNRLG
jgi:hypothetical protein